MVSRVGGKVILGIDPGSMHMGFGIVQEIYDTKSLKLIDYGVFHLAQYKTHMVRMRHIYTHLIQLLQKHIPDEVAIEAVFYGTNVQSMLKLGRAQGVAIAAALSYDIPVIEYAARKIKQAITGNGNASKEQVAAMVTRLLSLSDSPTLLDASDALAVALCHSQQKQSLPSKVSSWAQFVKSQPHRISCTSQNLI